jgi:uncharacterized protein (DUF2147 family)
LGFPGFAKKSLKMRTTEGKCLITTRNGRVVVPVAICGQNVGVEAAKQAFCKPAVPDYPDDANIGAWGGSMFRRALATAFVALSMTASAIAADAIVGDWRTNSGETATISGGGPFSIKLKTGKYAGKRIGTMNSDGGGKYSGEITDPAKDKTYSGEATLSGNTLKMSGCVFGGLICRSQSWTRR